MNNGTCSGSSMPGRRPQTPRPLRPNASKILGQGRASGQVAGSRSFSRCRATRNMSSPMNCASERCSLFASGTCARKTRKTSARTWFAPPSTARSVPSCSPAPRSVRKDWISIPGVIAWCIGTCRAIRSISSSGEGRVHRYKGHAVRRNVATAHGKAALESWQPGSDLWALIFGLADRAARDANDPDLVPHWIASGDCRVERHVPLLPYAREVGAFQRLKRQLAAYRVVFGQPRQEELIALLDRADFSVAQLRGLTIDLSPPDTELQRPIGAPSAARTSPSP